MPEKEGVFEKSDEIVGEEDEFLEPEEHTDAHVEHRIDIATGEQEADVYTEEGREALEESGEIAPWEEGFAQGAESRGHLAECAHCGKILGEEETEIVEREYSNRLYRFCSDKCAGAGPKQ